MGIYVPNRGEKGTLKQFLKNNALVLGLYKNQVVPDGNTVFDTLEEMPDGGGRGYSRIELSNDIVENAVTADKWYVSLNSSGKAEARYDDISQDWTFAAADLADANTVYGIFAFTWVLPFDTGGAEIKVGDKIKGATSGATGIVTSVDVQSGSWGAGTAAGYLYIKTKTGTFQNDENIIIFGKVATISVGATGAGGASYAVGDILQITQAGASGLKAVVSSVNAGAVTGAVLVDGGTGFSAADNLPTTHLTGGGNDACTLDIDTLSTAACAVSNTGAVADATKELMFMEAFTTGQLVAAIGQKVAYTLKLTLSTA